MGVRGKASSLLCTDAISFLRLPSGEGNGAKGARVEEKTAERGGRWMRGQIGR